MAAAATTRDVWKTVGVLGGGQLGRMMAEAGHRLGARVTVLDPTENCPAAQGKWCHFLRLTTPYACLLASEDAPRVLDGTQIPLACLTAPTYSL